jgi:hypothetical protein
MLELLAAPGRQFSTSLTVLFSLIGVLFRRLFYGKNENEVSPDSQ